MSAGPLGSGSKGSNNDLDLLAPHFADAVRAAIAECNRESKADGPGLDVVVYEAYRSQELQALYYARGRTIRPPDTPVTNAPTNLHSWHGFGLAVDVIHQQNGWDPPGGMTWFQDVARIFARHGCAWGGNWRVKDYAHFQWGACKPSPSDEARRLLATQGVLGVWRVLGAT